MSSVSRFCTKAVRATSGDKFGLVGIPVPAAEGVVILALFPGDVIVRVPLFEHRHVPVDQLLRDGLELAQQVDVGELLGHRSSGYLYLVVAPIYLCLGVTFKFCGVSTGFRAVTTGRHVGDIGEMVLKALLKAEVAAVKIP